MEFTMLSTFRNLKQYREYRKIFTSHRDVQVFRRLRNENVFESAENAASPHAIRVKDAGNNPLLCRYSSDAIILWDTYFYKYHQPLEALECNHWIVSLGANCGYTTAHMGCVYPKAKILAVEMDAANAELCRKNTAFLGDRVQVVNAAAWHEDGIVEYNPDVHVFAYAAHDTGCASSTPHRSVPSISIGTLIKNHGIEKIDFLKMDIEGAEFKIFKGDLAWLDIVSAANIEIHAPADVESVSAVMRNAGFRCERHPNHNKNICAVRT